MNWIPAFAGMTDEEKINRGSWVIRTAIDKEFQIGTNKNKLLKAFEKSRGLYKGLNLKKRIQQLRDHW
jgi:hypothetical protein